MSRARDRADGVLHNRTHEDTEGGRESIVTFKGEQSGGEISTLAQIQASHDGTADDQKADLIFKTNDGSDGSSPTERLRIDSGGSVLLGKSTPTDLHDTWNHLIIGEKGAIISENGSGGIDGISISDNAYIDSDTGAYAYQTTDETSKITQTGGIITFSNAASGTAGTAITFGERARIDTDGLKFNGDTAAGNALSDYEHGSGNATITGSGGGTITTVNDKTYYYTKIGNLVHFQVEFTLTGIGGCSGATQIALPFQSLDYVAGSLRAYNATYTGNSLFCEAHPAGTQVLLKSQSSGNASHDVLSSTTSYYFVTLTYLAT